MTTNDAPVTVEQSPCLTPGCRYSTEIKTDYAHSSYGNARVGVTALFPEWKGLKASTQEHLKHVENILHRHMEAAVAEIGQYDLTIGGMIAKDWPLPHRLAALASAPAGDGVEEAFRQALEDVCNPLVYLQRKAEAEGARLGGMAYAIANDIATVQGIARDALAAALARPRAAVGERDDQPRIDAWDEWAGDHLTDGKGYAAASVWERCRTAFNAAWPKGPDAASQAAILALQSPPAKVEG